MTHTRSRTLGIATAITLAGGLAVASPAAAAEPDVSSTEAAQAAVDEYGGCTINVEKDDYEGHFAWEVEISQSNANPDANGRIEVKVGANGTVLAKEDADTDDGEACDPDLPSALGDNGNGNGGDTFKDVDSSMLHYDNIMWLAKQDITKPTGDKYMPRRPVTRGSMTAFLYRLTHPGKAQPACTETPFQDVSQDDEFCGYIQWAYDNNVAFGDPDSNTYRPDDPVTRGAMTAYLHRIATDGAPVSACTTQPFEDVPVDGLFCGVISWAEANGITYGVGQGDNFATTDPVQRGPMASFLHRIDTYMS